MMSDLKKGLCPIGFLWRGDGIGVIFMRAGLLLAFLGALLKVSFLMFWPEPVSFREYFAVATIVWLLGKCLCALTYLKSGAQKRTRTSTKKNFTRT